MANISEDQNLRGTLSFSLDSFQERDVPTETTVYNRKKVIYYTKSEMMFFLRLMKQF